MAKHAQRPIVRKIIVEEAHGHHGGAWKVAYADFVTAMMAFFLLLWLISSADEETLVGLSQYFSDARLNNGTPGGVGGILDGISFTPEVMIRAPESPFNMQPTLPFRRDDQPETDLLDPNFAEGAEGGVELAGRSSPDGNTRPDERMSPVDRRGDVDRRGAADHGSTADQVSEDALEAALERRAREQVEAITGRLADALDGQPELRRFKDHLFVEDTAEGVRIQLVDQEQASMFPVGSDAMYPHTERLLAAVVAAVGGLPNRLSIRGHTDALPYAQGAAYDNWRLSSARADATRRTMTALGLAPGRVADVVGKGDGEPLLAEAPADPRNRRISIVLLDGPASR